MNSRVKTVIHLLLASTTLFALPSCQQSTVRPESNFVVKHVRIPDGMPWYSRFAVHSFVDYQPSPDDSWRRVEIVNEDSGIRHHEISSAEVTNPKRWNEQVRILSQEKTDGEKLAQEIQTFVQSYPHSEHYVAWPGPNSNSFAERLLKSSTEASAQLDHNAVGKNFGWYLGPTAAGTGFEVRSSYLGFAAGLYEGLEFQFIGLSAGVGIWPPSVKLPFLPRLPLRSSMAPQKPE